MRTQSGASRWSQATGGSGARRRATAGCVLSALPAGFAVFLAGRALQGAGLGLVPLATAVARDGLPAERSRRTIAAIGVTSFAASRIAARAARRTSAELVVAISCLVLIASTVLFLFARGTYAGVVAVMALSGFGVGSVYAVNPLQITGGVPAAETGSAISFYQLIRTVAYSIASALSATVLILATPPEAGSRPTPATAPQRWPAPPS